MTQDEIIEMATQVYGECVWHESALLRLEAFVKLVAAKATASEREACAKVCENRPIGTLYNNGTACAAAIRARGEA
jgi:hypothetical protein